MLRQENGICTDDNPADSRADLFVGASMVLVPQDMRSIDRARALLAPLGLEQILVMTAADHDRRFAYTAQLSHLISNAYVQSPTAACFPAFSDAAGQSLSHMADYDTDRMTEQLLDNSDNLLAELDALIACLQEYRHSLSAKDIQALRRRLQYGTRRKTEIDGG